MEIKTALKIAEDALFDSYCKHLENGDSGDANKAHQAFVTIVDNLIGAKLNKKGEIK